jgi:hypothetical protein
MAGLIETHLADFVSTCTFGRWVEISTENPERFGLEPIRQMPGSNRWPGLAHELGPAAGLQCRGGAARSTVPASGSKLDPRSRSSYGRFRPVAGIDGSLGFRAAMVMPMMDAGV